MGWALGFDKNWNRDVGYGVPAFCDHPECNEVIDRGLAFVCCEEEMYGGENGCGLYFCPKHRGLSNKCERCDAGEDPFTPKPDHPEWVNHKLTDESWSEWRDKHPEEVAAMQQPTNAGRQGE